MPAYINVSDVWKEVVDAYEKVSGSWKKILAGYERVGGVWKEFYESYLLVSTLSVAPSLTYAGYFGEDYGEGTFGALSEDTFVDHGSNSRTIVVLAMDGIVTQLGIAMDGSVPNTDATFIELRLPGGTFTRASATYQNPDPAGNTTWGWDLVSDPFLGTTVPVRIV